MTRRNAKGPDPAQLDLSLTSSYGAIGATLSASGEQIAAAIRRSRFSREQLVDQLRYLLGRDITLAQLNAWTAPTNANRMPADVLVALSTILNDWSPLATLLAPTGISLATATDRAAADLGRIQLDKETLAAREAVARRLLKGGKG